MVCRLPVESVERFSGEFGRVRDELERVGQGQEVFVVCATDAEVERLHELFRDTQLAAGQHLHFPRGHLRNGFRLVPERRS